MMADDLPPGTVHLNEALINVEHSSSDVKVATLVHLPNGDKEVVQSFVVAQLPRPVRTPAAG